MNENTNPLVDPLRQLQSYDTVTIRQIIDVYGRQSFGFVIALLAFIIVIPTGFIPGIAIITGLLMLGVTAQLLFGRSTLYMPQFVLGKQVPGSLVKSIISYAEKYHRYLDYVVGYSNRSYLFKRPFTFITVLLMFAVALSTVPLTLLPILETVPGLIMMGFGMAIAQGDGRILLWMWGVTVLYLWIFAFFGQQLLALIQSLFS